MELNILALAIHENAIMKGFYENGKAQNTGERLALIHAEVSEALEADRNGEYCEFSIDSVNEDQDNSDFKLAYKDFVKGTFEEEMADIIIRVLDMCAHKKIDIDSHVKAKIRYNTLREYMHGGKKY
jgi:NTP pyrophosphatase (non-canonical NTP hydrolase)